jgi:hypothetical protein
MKAQRAKRGVAILFLCPWHETGVGGQHHAVDALSLGRRFKKCIQLSGKIIRKNHVN